MANSPISDLRFQISDFGFYFLAFSFQIAPLNANLKSAI